MLFVLVQMLSLLHYTSASSFAHQLKKVQRLGAGLLVAGTLSPLSASAFGPLGMPLSNIRYEQVELCDGRPPIMPGQKAMEGLYPACVEVHATIENPSDKTMKDVSVYGFVEETDAGNSVLPNNPDFNTDSGQYAMIKIVPPGKSETTFQFVAATLANPKKGEKIPTLLFKKTKAVSFPGGDKFQPLDECEIDPRAGEAFDDTIL